MREKRFTVPFDGDPQGRTRIESAGELSHRDKGRWETTLRIHPSPRGLIDSVALLSRLIGTQLCTPEMTPLPLPLRRPCRMVRDNVVVLVVGMASWSAMVALAFAQGVPLLITGRH